MERDMCPDCDRPLAVRADLDRCEDGCEGCSICNALCWMSFHDEACTGTPTDWRQRAKDLEIELVTARAAATVLRAERDTARGKLEASGHALFVAEIRHKQLEEERDAARDCGQVGVCAIAPGCQRHWEERNVGLVAERDAARREVDAEMEAKHVSWAQLAKVEDELREVERVQAGLMRDRDLGEIGSGLIKTMGMLAAPLLNADAARNYVTMTFSFDEPGSVCPFDRAKLYFFRPGGADPHDLREKAEKERDAARADVERLVKLVQALDTLPGAVK